MCGIVGTLAASPVNQLLYDALLLLQHRGQDAAGIVTALEVYDPQGELIVQFFGYRKPGIAETSPSAAAPASIAIRASARLAMQQILTAGPARGDQRPLPAAATPCELRATQSSAHRSAWLSVAAKR